MRVVVFFALLGLLLAGGADNVFVDAQHTSGSYSPIINVKIKHPVQYTPDSPEYVQDTNLQKAAEHLISNIVEDDDVSQSFSRKQKLLARFLLSLAGMLAVVLLRKTWQSSPPFWDRLSCKYITQRTLRI